MARGPLLISFSVVMGYLLIVSPQLAHALEIKVSPQGEILFFQDGVLGDSVSQLPTAPRNSGGSITPILPTSSPRPYATPNPYETSVKQAPTTYPTNKISPLPGTSLHIETTPDDIQVKVTNDSGMVPGSMPGEPVEIQSTNTQRVRVQLPTQINDDQIEQIQEATIPFEEVLKYRAEQAKQQPVATTRPTPANDRGGGGRIMEYQQSLLEDRKNRTVQVEVKSRLDSEGKQELEIKSGSAKALLGNGSQFSFDTEINSMMITTPSGQEKILNHLPDQALEKMRQQLVIENTDTESADFTVETNQEGKIFYRTQGVQNKKFLGLFDRPIETEVLLDDETGEVTAVEKASPGILGQFLDVFTF